MKIKIEMTLDVDADAWREEMLGDPEASAREVRSDVRDWVRNDITMQLADRGLLVGTDRENGSEG